MTHSIPGFLPPQVGHDVSKACALPFIDVTEFGAVGDGKTDDTNALQEALNKGAATQCPVYFGNSSQTYQIRKSLTLGSNTRVFADGAVVSMYGDLKKWTGKRHAFVAQGSLDGATKSALSLNAAEGDYRITVKCTSGFSDGDYVQVHSNALYT